MTTRCQNKEEEEPPLPLLVQSFTWHDAMRWADQARHSNGPLTLQEDGR